MSVANAKPFLGVLIMLGETGHDWNALWLQVQETIETDAAQRGATLHVKEELDFDSVVSGTEGALIHLEEERPVSWMNPGAAVFDTLNHVLAVVYKPPYAFIHISDAILKVAVERILLSGFVSCWVRVPRKVLIHAYIQARPLRTLWLNGTHRQVSVKAASKVLAGSDLRDALDPLGDTSFVAGTVRSDLAGVSIRKSGLWLSRTRNWSAFADKVAEIQLALHNAQTYIRATPGTTISVHGTLAEEIEDLSGVHDPYHIQWADFETAQSEAQSEQLKSLISSYTLDLENVPPGSPDSDFRVRIEDESGHVTNAILSPELHGGELNFTCGLQGNSVIDAILFDSALLKVYYNSGHTFVDGVVTLTSVTDRPCESLEFQSFGNCNSSGEYKLDQEKPSGWPASVTDLFSDGDKSLFKWVYRNLMLLGFQAPNGADCWLYCDDGSMEVADFAHVYKPAGGIPKITLIHVKACSTKSGRKTCTGPYEIVIAQALKNLKAITAQDLHTRLHKRACDAFAHGQSRVWIAPWAMTPPPTTDPTHFLGALSSIGANCEYSVVVVQPHLKESTYNSSKSSTGAKQLRALLFTAEAAAKSVSATFRVICSNDF